MPNYQDWFVVGATGNVGKTTVKQIFDKGDTDPKKHDNPTRIVGLASSKQFVYDRCGISRDPAMAFCERKLQGNNYESLADLIFAAHVSTRDRGHALFFDATAAREEMTEFHLAVMHHTPYGIVTANKNPLALSSQDIFDELTRDEHRYGSRCSVMAGAGAIGKLRDLRQLGDIPISIEGCLSGTLGYICSALDEGHKLSEVVAEAKRKGYTEPHPRDDLSGEDVAKKILILARTAGFKLNFKEIPIIPFVDSKYLLEDNADAFVASLPRLDSQSSDEVKRAQDKGEVLRYVPMLENVDGVVSVRVGPQFVPRNSPLGLLKGTSNKIVIITETYTHDKPYIVQAPGAGLDITAQNARRDALYQIRTRTSPRA